MVTNEDVQEPAARGCHELKEGAQGLCYKARIAAIDDGEAFMVQTRGQRLCGRGQLSDCPSVRGSCGYVVVLCLTCIKQVGEAKNCWCRCISALHSYTHLREVCNIDCGGVAQRAHQLAEVLQRAVRQPLWSMESLHQYSTCIIPVIHRLCIAKL